MAAANDKAMGLWQEMSLVLAFDQNPRRRLIVIGAAAFVFIALIFAGISLVGHGGGCTAILSVQRYGCIEALAGRSGNVLLCSQIGNPQMQNSCIASVAEGKRNISDCSAFASGGQRNACIENVSFLSADPALCDGLDSYNQSICRYRIAASTNFTQISYCSGIRNATYMGMCTSQSYYHLALKTGNDTYCSGLPPDSDPSLVDAMSVQNPTSQSDDYGILSTVIETTPRDFCYASLSNVTSKVSCSQISNATLRASCDENASSSNGLISVKNASADCADESTKPLRDLCYFSVYSDEALTTGNESWCGLITNGSYMTSCIVNLASSTMNVTYCNELENSSAVQACVYEAQLANGNDTT